MKKVAIIGSGFSGLSAACYLARDGYDVTVFEKNDTIGGRARQFSYKGFTFDMGPTWYWMPDVYEKFFADFGKRTSDYYHLERLDPAYEIYFGVDDSVKISAELEELYQAFDQEEAGSSVFLRKFLKSAEYNYKAAIDKVIYRPGISPFELITFATIRRIGQFFSSISSTIRRHIKSLRLAHILEFPVIFLGAKPSSIPAFYCFMNYADLVLGTWHPKGGMFKVVEAMQKVAVELGAKIYTGSAVEKIVVEDKKVTGVKVNGEIIPTDAVISGADYHHSEVLLDEQWRNYSEKYWSRKVFAPSALMFYVGFKKRLRNVSHHTLFFDSDFDTHTASIYDTPGWPEKPLFYASFPTISDETLAPEGMEAAIFLIPAAPAIKDTEEIRKEFFDQIIGRMEMITGQSLFDSILFSESYSIKDFTKDYNAYKGNAYGLANTLFQTAFLKPKIRNKKLSNLFYSGQLTVPGPGVPPTIISGKTAARMVHKLLKD